MIRPVFLSILFTLLLAICARSQTPAPSPPASAWNALSDEVAKQVKWQPSGATSDDLYANRQKTREYLGEAAVPRLLQGILSADRARTAYFLADLKVAGKDWVEFHYDALDPEEIT